MSKTIVNQSAGTGSGRDPPFEGGGRGPGGPLALIPGPPTHGSDNIESASAPAHVHAVDMQPTHPLKVGGCTFAKLTVADLVA